MTGSSLLNPPCDCTEEGVPYEPESIAYFRAASEAKQGLSKDEKDKFNAIVVLAKEGAGGGGTVTSVDINGGFTGLTFVNGPITSNGTFEIEGMLSVASGGTGADSAVAARGNLGLGNVNNTSDANKPISAAAQAALDTKQNLSEKGAANGYTPLGSDTKVPSAYLPSYVDDVLEYANLAAFPATGESGKIYIAVDTNREYRWSGSTYVQIVASPGTTDNVPEGTTNLYYTPTRARQAITLSTTGTGAATYNTGTGALNIPTPMGTGDVNNGGNSYGAPMTIGTNDNNDVIIERNNIAQWKFTGNFTAYGDADTSYLSLRNNITVWQAGDTSVTLTNALLNFYHSSGNNATLNGSGTWASFKGYFGENNSNANAAPSAALEVNSITKTLLPPRMTTTQRDAIISPDEGGRIYNLTTHAENYWNGTSWKEVAVTP